MKSGEKNPNKELYNQLRRLSCDQLWHEEIPRFESASPEERLAKVSLVRAVGVVFSESGTAEQKDKVRAWLRALLKDPQEKIRRYAMTALPKVGVGASEEAELLALLRSTEVDREKKHLGETLQKVGGVATLKELGEAAPDFLRQAEQKVKASVARSQSPRALNLEAILPQETELRIHLRGRRGLEPFVRDELGSSATARTKFKVAEVQPGLVSISPVASFSLADLYSLRCFGSLGFVLGTADAKDDAAIVEQLASIITSPLARRILSAFSVGAIRYRLDFVGKGHQRGAVRLVANRAYALRPEILNDARNAPWTIAIHPTENGNLVELSPKLTPDPRFAYRQDDVPAASHPPLAACLARLAGPLQNAVIWDPFCGSGLELVERALLGGVRMVHGTDLSAEAIAVSERNLAAAKVPSVHSQFTRSDFRDFERIKGLGPGSVDLVITNPPMGKRVPIPNLRGLIEDLFDVAATVLKPGGKLVFANPLSMERPHPDLKREFRQVVDFGGFDCRVEAYTKSQKAETQGNWSGRSARPR